MYVQYFNVILILLRTNSLLIWMCWTKFNSRCRNEENPRQKISQIFLVIIIWLYQAILFLATPAKKALRLRRQTKSAENCLKVRILGTWLYSTRLGLFNLILIPFITRAAVSSWSSLHERKKGIIDATSAQNAACWGHSNKYHMGTYF